MEEKDDRMLVPPGPSALSKAEQHLVVERCDWWNTEQLGADTSAIVMLFVVAVVIVAG